MADVRSMLRAERASRRITHPNASYTSDGRLLCNLCEMMIKSEAAWQGHLHSSGHTLRLDRAREAAAARNVEATGKKRKAESLDSPSPDDKKRARSAGEEAPNTDRRSTEESNNGDGDFAAPTTAPLNVSPPAEVPANGGDEAVDEAELAAFERELAAMEQPSDAAATIQAGATISAAPLTAEELAAQAREEQSAQRGRRDAELEDEREDAALALQEEFEEMDSLEQRLRKLREKREALRKGSMQSGKRAEVDGAFNEGPKGGGGGLGTIAEGGGDSKDDETDDDDDEEDLDDWNFGAR